jgi:hypothetical protein
VVTACQKAAVNGGSDIGLRLPESLDAIASLPLAALLEQLEAFEPFQDIALNDEAGALETFVL